MMLALSPSEGPIEILLTLLKVRSVHCALAFISEYLNCTQKSRTLGGGHLLLGPGIKDTRWPPILSINHREFYIRAPHFLPVRCRGEPSHILLPRFVTNLL